MKDIWSEQLKDDYARGTLEWQTKRQNFLVQNMKYEHISKLLKILIKFTPEGDSFHLTWIEILQEELKKRPKPKTRKNNFKLRKK